MGASANAEVALASGRRALVRPLDEEEARALWEEGAALLPAERTTAALRRCLVATDYSPPEPLDLTVGERDALLLHARALSAGDAIPCVLECPACGEALELELSTRALAEPREPVRDQSLRPATGADHEWAARAALTDPAAAASGLLARCVVAGDDRAAPELADRFAALDPHAELALAASCPECGAGFETVFDPSTYVFAELGQRAARLEREVHALALAYGWSEREIVELGPARRGRYLDLLDEGGAA